ncbi:MAG: hypothetical protein QOG46_505 [Pseudonocardiales bacterium]|jgi:hypothetical protein|nr:hypothetical protein [Pseudonocardiales bacterium]
MKARRGGCSSYHSSGSPTTSDEVSWEAFYSCGMTADHSTGAHSIGTDATVYYGGLPRAKTGGRIMVNVQLCSMCTGTEENTIITTETAPADGTPTSVRGPSSLRRAVIAIPVSVVTAFFIFAGAPVATAAQAHPSNSLATGPLSLDPTEPCRGKVPGPCPGLMSAQQSVQSAAPELQLQQQTP